MAISHQSKKLELDIRYSEFKIAADDPQEKFRRYKEDHPGTHKMPSDPMFQPKQIGETSGGMPHMSHFNHPKAEEHYPYWSASDHKDAAHTHANHAHDLAIEKALGNHDLYNRHVAESGGDEKHHEEQSKLHMQAHDAKKQQFKDHDDMRQFMNLKESPRPIGTTQSGKKIFSVGNHPLHKDYSWEDHKDAAKNHYNQAEDARKKGYKNVADYHDLQASHHMNEIEKKAPSNVLVHPSMMKHQPKQEPQQSQHYYNHDETKHKLDELDKTRDIEPEEEHAPFVQKASSKLALRFLLS